MGGKETMSRWETVPPADLGRLPRDRDKVRTWLAILRVLDAASGGRGASPSPDGGTPQAMAARPGDRKAHAYLHLMPSQMALIFIDALATRLGNDPAPGPPGGERSDAATAGSRGVARRDARCYALLDPGDLWRR